MKCNIEMAKQTSQKSEKIDPILTSDQLTKLTQLLIAIMTGDHSQFSFLHKPIQAPSSAQGNTPTTPQQVLNKSNSTTPTQTLQTKILRSSTTSFGGDTLAARRKVTATGSTSSQPTTYTPIGQINSGTNQVVRPNILGRQSSGGS